MTNETGRAGLLPCPFCGGEAEFKPYKKDGLTIKCKSFGCVRRDQRVLRQSIDWLREAMAKDWNTRTNPPPVDAAAERDATRYRWLRTHFKFANDSTREIWFDGDTLVDEPSELDESIDVAITAQQQESGHE